MGVLADLPLVDGRPVMPVDVLDRVLDGEDVAGTGVVDVVEHRRESRGLATAGRTGHEDEPVGKLRQALGDRREPEILERWNLEWDGTHRQPAGPTLVEGVGPEPCEAAPVEGEVDFLVRLEPG